MKPLSPRPPSRVLPRLPVAVSGCLALACWLMLGAADGSAASTVTAAYPHVLPVPLGSQELGSQEQGSAVLDGSVAPVDTEVARDENGEFTLTVVNRGSVVADNVRVLLDDEQDGNGVGSPDGRCLSRLDAASPADLWCELGDVAPLGSVAVQVHAFMSRCAQPDPGTTAPYLHAPAFRWRVGYTDGGQAVTVNGPAPRWSCSDTRTLPDFAALWADPRP